MDPHPAPPPLPISDAWPPPAPPPWPPEPVLSQAPARDRRWPVVLLVIGGLLAAATGVAIGAATGTATAAAVASTLAANGQYARAIAIDEAIAVRTGPFYLLDPGAATTASRAAQQTLMAWGAALGRKGDVDQAVALYRSVTASPLRKQALDNVAALLFRTSTSDAAAGNYSAAILRLEEAVKLAPATPDGAAAVRQLPSDEAGEAGLLVLAGRATDAVSILNAVVHENSAQATRTADGLLPAALLAAGQEDLADDYYREALTDLQQLVAEFSGTTQAAQAAVMLAAPQTVSGTLVTHVGGPVSGRVRLSSHYKAEPNGMYQTSAPFFYTTSDASGDFTFSAVPVGGPYVLEVFADGNWTTLINPTTNQPANPVTVTALIPVDLTFVVLPSS